MGPYRNSRSRLAQMVLTLLSLLVLACVAMAQSVDAPTRSVGDTWTHSDGLVVTVVKGDDGGSIERGYLLDCQTCLTHFDKSWNLNGVSTDADGKPVDVTRLLRVFVGPGWRFYDWPLQVKKKWYFSGQAYLQGRPVTYNVAATVVGYEDVKTKAGAFKAFKIQYDWEMRSLFFGTLRWSTTNWYAPEVRSLVKFTTTSTASLATFFNQGEQDWELVSYSVK